MAIDNPTIGVVVISRNEEIDLPVFLEHLISWVDEIVIIDDGSTDQTEKIASSAGEKVKFVASPRSNGEFFAEQRNKGIDMASSDWLLHMDVDERVSPGLAEEIKAAIRNPDFDGYRLRRKNYFLHRPMRGGGLSDWNRVHLAKRDLLRFSGMYHEGIELDIRPQRIGQLKNKIFHLNDDSYKTRLYKSGMYQEEVAEQIRREHKKLRYINILGAFLVEFAYKYFWKLGILDGTPGLIWALHSASANFRAHTIVWDEQNRIPREMLESELVSEWDNLPEAADDST